MNDEPVLPSRWQGVLEQMFEELRTGSPRAEVYWAQQLAFGPVFFYAVVLAVRGGTVPAADLDLLRPVVPLALSLLGALPDGSDGDPASLILLARRQAQALALGRRQQLTRLAARLGLAISSPFYDPVPSRLRRPYELIGWRPPGQVRREMAGRFIYDVFRTATKSNPADTGKTRQPQRSVREHSS